LDIASAARVEFDTGNPFAYRIQLNLAQIVLPRIYEPVTFALSFLLQR
jgi:hypothetical protein